MKKTNNYYFNSNIDLSCFNQVTLKSGLHLDLSYFNVNRHKSFFNNVNRHKSFFNNITLDSKEEVGIEYLTEVTEEFGNKLREKIFNLKKKGYEHGDIGVYFGFRKILMTSLKKSIELQNELFFIQEKDYENPNAINKRLQPENYEYFLKEYTLGSEYKTSKIDILISNKDITKGLLNLLSPNKRFWRVKEGKVPHIELVHPKFNNLSFLTGVGESCLE